MLHRRLTALATLPLITMPLITLAACGGSDPAASSSIAPTAVVRTSFPDLATPTGEPELAAIGASAPSHGTIGRIAGPFDDRFRLGALHFDGQAVTGRIGVTSDVSDILELQVLAGFYNGSGTLIGQGRFTYHLDEDTHHDTGRPNEHRSFEIAVPAALRAKVHTVAVGVPVLVNE